MSIWGVCGGRGSQQYPTQNALPHNSSSLNFAVCGRRELSEGDLYRTTREEFSAWVEEEYFGAKIDEPHNPAPSALFYACNILANDSDTIHDMINWKSESTGCTALRYVFGGNDEYPTDGLNSKFEGDYVVDKLRVEDEKRMKNCPPPRAIHKGSEVVVDFASEVPLQEQNFGVVQGVEKERTMRRSSERTGGAVTYRYQVSFQRGPKAGTQELVHADRVVMGRGDAWCSTALIMACACEVEQAGLVKTLINLGANVRAQNSHHKTALHMAARNGYVNTARHLMALYPDLDAQDEAGESPMHTAVRFNQVAIIKLLLAHEASLDSEDHDGLTEFGRCLFIRMDLDLLLWQLNTTNEAEELVQEDTQDHTLSPAELAARRAAESRGASWCAGFTLVEADALRESNQETLECLLNAGANFVEGMTTNNGALETTIARRYFENQEEWHQAVLSPNVSYDEPMFSELANQIAIDIVWRRVIRQKSWISLLGWIFFLGLFTYIAMGEGGGGLNPLIGQLHMTIANHFIGEYFNTAQSQSFPDIGEDANLWDWIDNVWTPKVYGLGATPGNWRNSSGGQQTVASNHFANFFIFTGRPRIRQWRVQADKEACIAGYSLDEDTQAMQPCFKEWGPEISDMTAFGPGRQWTFSASPYYDNFYPEHINGGWGTELQDDGFSVVMPRNSTAGQALIQELKENAFVDMNTRILMFEAALTAPSTYVTTVMRLFVLRNANGGYRAVPYLSTSKLTVSGASQLKQILLWIFGAMVVLYILSEFQSVMEPWHPSVPKDDLPHFGPIGLFLLDSFGDDSWVGRYLLKPNQGKGLRETWLQDYSMWKYFMDPFNLLDLIIMALFKWTIVIFVLIHIEVHDVKWHVGDTQDVVLDSIFYLDRLQERKMKLLAFNLFFCYIKALEYLYVSRKFAMMVKIIFGMLYQLISFAAVMCIFLLAFSSFSYITSSLEDQTNANFASTFFNTFSGSLGNIGFDGTVHQSITVKIIFFFTFSVVMVILLLNLLIAIMSEAYETVKGQAAANWAFTQLKMIVSQAEDEQTSTPAKAADGVYACCFSTLASVLCKLTYSWLYRVTLMPSDGRALKQHCSVWQGKSDALLVTEEESVSLQNSDEAPPMLRVKSSATQMFALDGIQQPKQGFTTVSGMA